MKRSSSRLMQSIHTRRELARRGAAVGVSIPALAGLFSASELTALAQDGSTVSLASNQSKSEPRADWKDLSISTTRVTTALPSR